MTNDLGTNRGYDSYDWPVLDDERVHISRETLPALCVALKSEGVDYESYSTMAASKVEGLEPLTPLLVVSGPNYTLEIMVVETNAGKERVISKVTLNNRLGISTTRLGNLVRNFAIQKVPEVKATPVKAPSYTSV
ncbi:MAG: hypothetical protein ABIE94_05655 [archaeon]